MTRDDCTALRRRRPQIANSLGSIAGFASLAAPPVCRIALALPFFRSGLTRWDSFLSLSPGTVYLFEEQFKLHLFGRLYAFPFPLACAYVVGAAEVLLPVLLVFGLATRAAAAGLLIMTAVIQLANPSGWANFHLYWFAIGLAIIALGGGRLSLDELWSQVVSARKSSILGLLRRHRYSAQAAPEEK
jgi:putative oxidoreductase